MYNNMMYRHRIVTGLCVLCGFIPTAAGAYLSPEDVLSGDSTLQEYSNDTRYATPPPNARSARTVAELQAEKSKQQRSAAQAGLAQDSADDSILHAAAGPLPDEEDARLNALIERLDAALQDQNEIPTAASDAQRDQRILERVQHNQQIADDQARFDAWRSLQGYPETLHSGAPLNASGMGSVVAILLTLIGGGCIIGWATRLQRVSRVAR